jgi:hypothetical protein
MSSMNFSWQGYCGRSRADVDSFRYDAKCLAEGMGMEFKEYDFTRNPVVQNEVFYLQSKCGACGFSVLVRSLEELIEHETLHRTQCSRSDSVV